MLWYFVTMRLAYEEQVSYFELRLKTNMNTYLFKIMKAKASSEITNSGKY